MPPINHDTLGNAYEYRVHEALMYNCNKHGQLRITLWNIYGIYMRRLMAMSKTCNNIELSFLNSSVMKLQAMNYISIKLDILIMNTG